MSISFGKKHIFTDRSGSSHISIDAGIGESLESDSRLFLTNTNDVSQLSTDGALVSSGGAYFEGSVRAENFYGNVVGATLATGSILLMSEASGNIQHYPTMTKETAGPTVVYNSTGLIYNPEKILLSTTNSNITRGTYVSLKVTNAYVTSETVASTLITNAEVTLGTIGSALITNANVTSGTIGTAFITNANITSGTLVSSLITNANITSGTLVSSLLTNAKITSGTLTSATIISGNANITSGTLTNANITSGTLTNANITSGTVVSSLITNANITSGTLVSSLITNANITSGTLTTANITSGTLTNANITSGTILDLLVSGIDSTYNFNVKGKSLLAKKVILGTQNYISTLDGNTGSEIALYIPGNATEISFMSTHPVFANTVGIYGVQLWGSSVASCIIDNACTLYIDNGPSVGNYSTISSSYALFVAGGICRFPTANITTANITTANITGVAYCSVYGTGGQGIDTATDTALTSTYWNGTVITNGPVTYSNGVITVTNSGYYSITANVCFANNSTGFRSIFISLNNSTTGGSRLAYTSVPPVNGDRTGISVSCNKYLAASENLRVYVYQTSGASLNMDTGVNGQFSVIRIA